MIEAPDGLGWGPEGQDSLRYARIARDVDDKENGVGVLEYQAELSRYPLQIIVTTCDDYRGLMPALADRFNFYWPNVKKVDVLCFEEPDRLPPNFLIHSMGKQTDYGDDWTTPVCGWIQDHAHELFVLLLDDHMITEPVDQDRLDVACGMFAFPSTGKVDLTNLRAYRRPEKVAGLHLVPQNNPHRASTATAVWRKEYFLQSYRVGRRIWQAESLGEQEAVNDGWNVWSVRPSIIHYADVVQKGVLNLETPGGV